MAPKIEIVFNKSPSQPTYEPGENITGYVVVTISNNLKAQDGFKPITIVEASYLNTAIEVRFKGSAHTGWCDYGRRTYYTAHECYFDQENVVWPSNGRSASGVRLTSGSHRFPFNFNLPANSPSSFKGSFGWIRYAVHVRIDLYRQLNSKANATFIVLCKDDLNRDPLAQKPSTGTSERSIGCFHPKPVALIGRCEGASAPGEKIQVTLDVDNKTSTGVSKVSMCLKRVVTYTGVCWRCGGSVRHRVVKERLTDKTTEVIFPANSNNRWTGDLLVPDLLPSNALAHCSIIDLAYYVQIKVRCKKDVKLSLPIHIGTVPFQRSSLSGQNDDYVFAAASTNDSAIAVTTGVNDQLQKIDMEPDQTALGYYDWKRN